jgi:hypothetical protein
LPRKYKAIICLVVVAGFLEATRAAYSQQQVANAQTNLSDPTLLNTIVDRMEAAQQKNHESFRPYTLTREYKLYDEQEQQPKSDVIADVSFVPPDRQTYTIEQSEGASRGLSIVRHVLDAEAQAVAKPNAPAAITRRNYDFKLVGEEAVDGQPCWVLELDPKREDKMLVRGRAWIDKDTYLIHRIQGQLAKSPSWWLKSVNTRIDFGGAAGMWLQTRSHAEADVRIFGVHTFTSQAVKLQTEDQVATRFSPIPPKESAENLSAYRLHGHERFRDVSYSKHHRVRRVEPLIGAGIVP